MMIQPDEGIVIVTGGGSGLGRAMVLKLSEKGYRCVAIGRQKERLDETVSLSEDRAFAYQLDVADPEAVRQVFRQIIEQHGNISLLINNAAIYPQRDLLDETAESYFSTCNVNFGGVVSCSLAALENMKASGKGRILNVSTFAGEHPLPGASAYSVSKGASRLFTKAMIADLKDRFPDIVINEWMPGMLNTQMGIPQGLSPEIAAEWGVDLALQKQRNLTGTTFEMNTEILPPRSLKGRIKDLILLRRAKPRQLPFD